MKELIQPKQPDSLQPYSKHLPYLSLHPEHDSILPKARFISLWILQVAANGIVKYLGIHFVPVCQTVADCSFPVIDPHICPLNLCFRDPDRKFTFTDKIRLNDRP